MKYYCNPINVKYFYQMIKSPDGDKARIHRSAADFSLILYEGRYYVFASGIHGIWVSDDLVSWLIIPN